MKVEVSQRVPQQYNHAQFMAIFKAMETQMNLLAEGRLAGRHFTSAAVPTVGSFAQGDIIWKTAPVEAGSAGSKYVNLGWVCTVAGSPGTLLEMRVLTGN